MHPTVITGSPLHLFKSPLSIAPSPTLNPSYNVPPRLPSAQVSFKAKEELRNFWPRAQFLTTASRTIVIGVNERNPAWNPNANSHSLSPWLGKVILQGISIDDLHNLNKPLYERIERTESQIDVGMIHPDFFSAGGLLWKIKGGLSESAWAMICEYLTKMGIRDTCKFVCDL